MVQFIAGIGMAFIPEIWSFMALRCLTGMVHAPFYSASFSLSKSIAYLLRQMVGHICWFYLNYFAIDN